MKVLALALALSFASSSVALAKKPYRASETKHSKIKRNSKVKRAPKAAKIRRSNANRPRVN